MSGGSWAFAGLNMFGYDVIAIDPPWTFDLYSDAGAEKSAGAQYALMSFEDIKAMRVGDLAAPDCLLLLWCCEWMDPAQRSELIRAWGFTYRSAFMWRKTTVNGKVRMGTGYRVRSMHEPVLLATVGNPQHRAFPSIFDGVAREHSRKPEEFYALVDACCPDTRRADIFSRERRPGWDGWGNELGKFDAAAEAAR